MVELFLCAPVCVCVCVCVCVGTDAKRGRGEEGNRRSFPFLLFLRSWSSRSKCYVIRSRWTVASVCPRVFLVVLVLSLSLSHCVVLRPTPWDFLSLGNKITGDNDDDDDDNKDSRPTGTKTLPTTRYNVPRMTFLSFLWFFHQNDCSFLIG